MMDNFLRDISWIMPYRNDVLTPVFEVFTFLGYSTFITLFLSLLYWFWNKEAAMRLLILVLLSSLLNGFLKDFWLNPRPDISMQMDPAVAQSYGMPSGHAQIAAVLWLWFAYELRKLGHGVWVWFGAIFTISMICLSRIYLGVHDLEDIMAGLAIGGISLLLFRASLSSKLSRFRNLDAQWHLPMIIMLTAVMAMTWPGLGVTKISGTVTAQSYEILTVSGLLMGSVFGRQLYVRYIDFEWRPALWNISFLPRLVAGVLGVSLVFLLLAVIPIILSSFNQYTIDFLSLAILGLFTTVGAPLIFKLFRLAH